VGKYDPLRDYLAALPEDAGELTMSFGDIEELVGQLPRSARSHQAWWANTDDTRVEAQAWRAAGWHVVLADQTAEQVVFARRITDSSPAAARDAVRARRVGTSSDRGTPDDRESRGLERIAFFSDAVFAIAITLLVLDLTLPPHTTASNLPTQLATLWPKYGAFAFTFTLIGLRWLTHLVQFRDICQYDNTLLGLNVALLLVVAFLPFPSRVLAEYPDSRAASALYVGSMAVAGLLSTALWVHACWIGRLVDEKLKASARRNLLLRWITLPILFGIALILLFAVPSSLWPARAVALATPFVQILIAILSPQTPDDDHSGGAFRTGK
jgi:uncharacterized membrane protein